MNEVIQIIDQEIARLKGLEESIRYVSRKHRELTTLKEKLQVTVDKADPVDKAIAEIKKAAKKHLEDELNAALNINTEFDYPIFKSRLFAAIRDEQTIQYTQTPDGVRVKIDMDLTAGTLNDYSQAVDTVRQNRMIGPYGQPPAPPALAAKMWMEKYYQPAREGTIVPRPPRKTNVKRKSDAVRNKEFAAKYRSTMKERIAAMSTLAPYWSLLNNGDMRMESSYTNPAYPKNVPTHFVEKAEISIQRELDASIREQKIKIEELRKEIVHVNDAISYLSSINFDARNPKEVLQEVIEKRLGEKFGRADQNKVMQLADDILAGETSSRVSLGGGVRIRTLEIRSIIAEFRRRTGK